MKIQILLNSNMIKKKYNETRMGIITLYPQLKELADSICFDSFLDNMYVDGQPMILTDFAFNHALHKIEYWKWPIIWQKTRIFLI